MADLVRMSEATALALHAMVLAAEAAGAVSAPTIACELRASEAHIAKVLRTLTRAGFLTSKRGPTGGYALARPKSEIRLLDIYETFEGQARRDRCLFAEMACRSRRCILDGLVARVRNDVHDYLATTTLADI